MLPNSDTDISMSDEQAVTSGGLQRFFGTGSKRKIVDFVAAAAPTQDLAPRTTPPTSAGDRYLGIVLTNPAPIEVPGCRRNATQQQLDPRGALCEICGLSIDIPEDATSTASANHESTIAHMVCLTHSHPPSHLDRSRQGLKYLSSYGWDPNSRAGLGPTGKGMKAPVKAKLKNDTVGLGVKMKGNKKTPDAKVEKLDAKRLRKKDVEDRRKWERLQDLFYRNEDVEKYLGCG